MQLSESSFHILLLSIYFTKFNFISHFTLKKMEKWNYFWCKTKEFLLTKWILDLTLSTIFFILLFFCWIQNYNCPLHCRTVYILWFCSLFFNVEQTYSAVFVRNFLLLCYFWMITWLLMTFVDLFLLFLFPFTWPYFFFSSLFARIFRYPSFSLSTLFHRQVPFGDYLVMFLLITFSA